jgi:hypothetical protein
MCGFSEVKRSSKSLFLLLFLALMYTIYTLQRYPLALKDSMLCVTYTICCVLHIPRSFPSVFQTASSFGCPLPHPFVQITDCRFQPLGGTCSHLKDKRKSKEDLTHYFTHPKSVLQLLAHKPVTFCSSSYLHPSSWN